ncbi:MAG: histidinol-phosphate transaminase [Acidobacteria bacterium]|nr:histidinol-phosphate transaminase [Acidobacteriota bacterium]
MSDLYERAPERGPGLRLHLNENTAGCSPRVLNAMRAVTAGEAAFYPDYGATLRACARWLGIDENRFFLTNGLDEGIYSTAVAWLQRLDDGQRADAIVVEPAYALFAASASVVGARVIRVGPRPDFSFPLAETLNTIGPATRVVFIASPANPSGVLVTAEEVRAVATRLPPGAIVFLDEAYIEFAGTSFLDELVSCPNVLLGRTFAKAYGLAAVRAGYLVGARQAIGRVRSVTLPFSVNVFALAATRAAIDDGDYVKWYVAQVEASRRRIYEACERLGLEYWKSQANFVLVRVGPGAPALVEALAARRVYVRDRSNIAGCGGCIRITAGLVEHTTACLAELEDLCARA